MKEPEETPKNAPVESPKAPDDGALRTPREWGIEIGHIKPGSMTIGGIKKDARSADHCAAAAIHGWDLHQSHSTKPLQISRKDYDAALEAARSADEQGNYSPHLPACSPHSPFRK